MNLIELLAHVQYIMLKHTDNLKAKAEIEEFFDETGVAKLLQKEILGIVNLKAKRFDGIVIDSDDTTPRSFRLHEIDRLRKVPMTIISQAIKNAAPAELMQDNPEWCKGCNSAREFIMRRVREHLYEETAYDSSQFTIDCGLTE